MENASNLVLNDQLPPNWTTCFSKTKQKVFYYNAETKKTQWHFPQVEPNLNKKRKLKEDSVTRSSIKRSIRVGASFKGKNGTKFSAWDHQIDAVEQLIHMIKTNATNHKFLLQHSTGAGKTITMAALAYQLLYAVDPNGDRFHTVVILIDRLKLDEQVGSAVQNFLRRNGIEEVFRAETIDHLSDLLTHNHTESSEQRVIITTVQKVSLLIKNNVLLTRMVHHRTARSKDFRRIAVITDEAHRSHGNNTRKVIEAVINAAKGNESIATFVGFTATPSLDALRLFGNCSATELRPFHCYPISKAIQDGRVLDVLQDLTCVRCKVETSIPMEIQERLREKKVYRRVLDHASALDNVLHSKFCYMMTHFHQIKGSNALAKCMIVTRSRYDVLRYHRIASEYIATRNLSWQVFGSVSSGSSRVVGSEVETGEEDTVLISEKDLNDSHSSLAGADIVIVCEKLDTGYNDPYLSALYIDRFLQINAHIFQLFSRLNRRTEGKNRVQVMDFSNHPAQIRSAFAEFWNEKRAPVAKEQRDLLTEKRNFITGTSMLLTTFLPLLRDAPPSRDEIDAYVEESVLHFDRDSFQQVLHALELVSSAQRWLSTDWMHSIVPVSLNVLNDIKKAVESHLPNKAEKTCAKEFEDMTRARMNVRVADFVPVFSGRIFPAALEKRCLSETEELKSKSNQFLHYGLLELFEVLSVLLHCKKESNERLLESIRSKVEAKTKKKKETSEISRLVLELVSKAD